MAIGLASAIVFEFAKWRIRLFRFSSALRKWDDTYDVIRKTTGEPEPEQLRIRPDGNKLRVESTGMPDPYTGSIVLDEPDSLTGRGRYIHESGTAWGEWSALLHAESGS